MQSGGYGYAGLEGREDWPGVSDALVSYTAAAAAAASPIPAPQHFYTQVGWLCWLVAFLVLLLRYNSCIVVSSRIRIVIIFAYC